MLTSSPCSTVRLTLCTASTSPYRTWSPQTSSNMIFFPPQIGFDDLGIVRHLRRSALSEFPAVIQHDDPVGEPHGHPHVVLDEEDGDPEFPDLPYQVLDDDDLLVAEAGERFVQQEELRVQGQCPGDLELSQVAEGQGPGDLLRLLRSPRSRGSPRRDDGWRPCPNGRRRRRTGRTFRAPGRRTRFPGR